MSAESWKLSAYAPKQRVQAALLTHDEIDEWDFELAISGREISEERPQDWVLEGWYPREPGQAELDNFRSLFEGRPPKVVVEKLPAEDWLTVSQHGVEPISAGRFYVHTPDFEPNPHSINFAIPAAQAFGTGQHETTAGCLEMLGAIEASGVRARNIADIGTGTGLLGFAAMALWPSARLTATDIDPVCAQVIEDNAELNSIRLGADNGEMTVIIAPGMDDELIQLRGPYDILIANILAGPLIELSRDFAAQVSSSGSLVLAGLLAGEQEQAVRRAYRLAGFRLVSRLERGDWAILWFKRRHAR